MRDAAWAIPEEAPVDDTAEARPPDSILAPSSSSSRRPVPVLPVFDRPLTVADILDGAFAVIKARPRTVLLISATFVLPLGALIAVIDPAIFGGDALASLTDPDTYDEGAETADSNLGLSVISTLVTSLLVTAMAAPIARIVEAWYLGRDLGAADALRGLGLGWLSVAAGFVVVHVLEAVALALLVLPGIAAMALFLVVTPVIAVERVGPIRGIRRSVGLVRARFWPVLWIALLSALVSGTLSVMLPLLPLTISSLVGFGGDEYVATAGTVAASVLTLPFVAAAAVMTYFDLRVRTEGLDLQLAVIDQFGDG